MYKLIKKEANSFILEFKDLIVTLQKITVCYFPDLTAKWVIDKLLGNCISTENYFLFSNSGEVTKIDEEGNILEKFNFFIQYDAVINLYGKPCLLGYKKKDGEKIFGLYNFDEGKFIWNLRIKIANSKFIYKDSLYTNLFNEDFELDNTQLFSFSLNSGKQLWQFSFSQLSNYITDEGEEKLVELVSIIGVYNTILWLLVTDRRLVGLNAETGALLHEVNLCESLGLKPQTVENYSFSMNNLAFKAHLDEEKGIIKSFAHRYYWELDLNTLKADIKVDFGPGNTWRIQKSKFYEGDKNLYFIGAKNGETFDRAIGIFDTEKYEITWYDEPLGEGRYLFFTDIQANDKLLGALDSEQNLRIYEKV
ncbi:hypothetical protein V3Q90_15135 [Flavobacterium oreochromis]|uniref:hypothetical protein n=1 Tax=Flavobacterium oreochromis TaxID=2906078 RepID=UPI00385B1212